METLAALYRSKDLFSSRGKNVSFDKMNMGDVDDQFSVFRDYLGLIKLIQPESLLSPMESPTESNESFGSYFDFPQYNGTQRHRMNSLEDSDAISDSSSSGSRTESDTLYESINSTSDFRTTAPNDNILTQTYAQTLESIIANQKNTLNRIAPASLKDNRSKSSGKAAVCVFCRNNGESREFYSSHTLKDNEGSTTCPILRAYTCPLCKANGDQSHTIKYCPKYTPKLKTDKILGITL